jgi:hypothetical protein
MSEIAVEIIKGGWPVLAFAGFLFLVSLAVFGFMPGILNRAFARLYPLSDPRRAEMIAELYAVPLWEQPWWVFRQAERAVFEGISARWAVRRTPMQASPAHIAELAKSTSAPGGKYPPARLEYSFFHGQKSLDDKSSIRVALAASELWTNSDYIAIPSEVKLEKALHGGGGVHVKRKGFMTTVVVNLYEDDHAESQ